MQTLPPAIRSNWARLSGCATVSRTPPLRSNLARWYHKNTHDSTKEREGPAEGSFERLRLHPPVLEALRQAFPAIEQPTPIQYRFIDAVLKGKDVILKDRTGTGKSFALALALLCQKRRIPHRDLTSGTRKTPITSLLLVPHRDLAFQIYHWIERIHQHMKPQQSLPSLAQVFVRDSSSSAERLASIREEPPHILIATPQSVLDIVQRDVHALPLGQLATVVVDEVDYLIQSVPLLSDKYKMMKIERQVNKHPGPTRLLLNHIYSTQNVRRKDAYQMERHRGTGSAGDHRRDEWAGAPQLVMLSATLRNSLKRFLLADSGWFAREPGKLVRITGDASAHYPTSLKETDEEDRAEWAVGGTGIQHHVLVVSEDGETTNIKGAVKGPPPPPPPKDAEESSAPPVTPQLNALSMDLDVEEMENPSPFNPTAIEAICSAFALDVPSVALLVLKSDAPVQQAVKELRLLGVNAQPLDVVKDENGKTHLMRRDFNTTAENPTLLVSTLASTRGLDLPELSHVFILGLLDEGAVDSYLHVAGRVGRFGRGGKVISVLEDVHDEQLENGKQKKRDEPRKIGLMFRRMGIKPVMFEHFD